MVHLAIHRCDFSETQWYFAEGFRILCGKPQTMAPSVIIGCEPPATVGVCKLIAAALARMLCCIRDGCRWNANLRTDD